MSEAHLCNVILLEAAIVNPFYEVFFDKTPFDVGNEKKNAYEVFHFDNYFRKCFININYSYSVSVCLVARVSDVRKYTGDFIR